ncbi:MAG: hypothetical protein GX907_05625 [Clostridiaceae bacterium]|nr:hypothetical protein [Clostridiaceae bacterium]
MGSGSSASAEPGDKVIVPLENVETVKVGDFFSVYGMYYVTADSYVLSAFDEGDSDLAKTGMTKEQALRELNAQRTDPRKNN